MDERAVTLELCLQSDSGADADQRDREVRQLRSELQELGFGSAEPKPDRAPDGAKSVAGFVLGTLLIEVLPSVISPLIDSLKSWIGRRAGRTVKVKTTISDRSVETEFDPATISPAQVKTLVASILRELDRTKG